MPLLFIIRINNPPPWKHSLQPHWQCFTNQSATTHCWHKVNTELRGTCHIFEEKTLFMLDHLSHFNLILSGKINRQATLRWRRNGSCRLQAWEWVFTTNSTRLDSPWLDVGPHPYCPDSKLETPNIVRRGTIFGNSWLHGETWARLHWNIYSIHNVLKIYFLHTV